MATTLRTSGITMGSSTMDVSGSAPSFPCRAFVNFNGTNGTVRHSGNISSVTRHGSGDYTVNIATAFPNADYVLSSIAASPTAGDGNLSAVHAAISGGGSSDPQTKSTTACRIRSGNVFSGGAVDLQHYLIQFTG